MSHVVLKDYPHHLTKYEGKVTSKIPIFKLFSGFGKNLKCSLSYETSKFSIFFMNWKKKLESVCSPRPTFKNPNIKSIDELGKVMS